MERVNLLRTAHTNLDLGRLAEARRDLDLLLRADPHDADARVLLVETLRQQGEFASADAVLEPLLADSTYRAFACRTRSLIALGHVNQLERSGDFLQGPLAARRKADALHWAREAVRLEPTAQVSVFALSQALHLTGATREALDEARRAVALSTDASSHAEALANLAQLLSHHPSMKAEARAAGQQAAALDPESTYVRSVLANVQLRTGRQAVAMRTALDELRRAPTGTHMPRVARGATFLLTARLLAFMLLAALAANLAVGILFDGEWVEGAAGRVGGAIGLLGTLVAALVILFPLRERSIRDAVWRFVRGSVMAWVAVGVVVAATLLHLTALITGGAMFFVAFPLLLVMIIVHWMTFRLQIGAAGQ